MMLLKTRCWIIGFVIAMVMWAGNPSVCKGFNDNAHKILSTRAIEPALPNAAQLDTFLKTMLVFEFPQGIKESFHGGQDGTVQGQIRLGAVREDGGQRPSRHFHDPTKTWESAGLSIFPVTFESSVVWSQNSAQSPGGKHSWKDARDAYFNALTGTTEELRKTWYAELFQSLGHLMHLVQDAAVPAHTRNDSHFVEPYSGLKIDADPFHYWADSPVGLGRINSVTSALRFDSSILNQATANPLAPVPVARIIDKTDGDLGILSPNLNIGLAEYSNANFISKGTARSTSYLYPLYSQLEFGTVETLPGGKKVRYARFRPGFGEQDYRVGVSSRMALFANANVPPDSIDFGLDDNVHEDYGRKLFPRAIGYSAGLIDYFFRAYVDSTWNVNYTFETPWASRPTSLTVDNVKVVVSGTAQETGSGTIRMVLLHYNSFTGAGGVGGIPSGPAPEVVVSNEVPFTVGSQPQNVTFPFSALPFPTIEPEQGCCTGHLYMAIMVYKGTLGQEQNIAVAASGYCYDPPSGEKWEKFYSFERKPGIAYIGDC